MPPLRRGTKAASADLLISNRGTEKTAANADYPTKMRARQQSDFTFFAYQITVQKKELPVTPILERELHALFGGSRGTW